MSLSRRLYFAFPDGSFDYVCSECTAVCCRRGAGFGGNLQREMGPLLAAYPQLALFASNRKRNFITIETPPDRCYFLENDNRCRIEREHGKSLKPSVCNVFPFNNFLQIGATVVVRPHFLCPLRLCVPPQPGRTEGTHELLRQSIEASGLLECRFPDQTTLKKNLPRDFSLSDEEIFRENCSKALGKRRFRDVVVCPDSSLELLHRAAALLGVNGAATSPAPDALDSLLLALAPGLRFDMLDLPSPVRAVALLLADRLLRYSQQLTEIALTPQAAHSLITSRMNVLKLLARADSSLRIPKRWINKAPPFEAPDMTIASFVFLKSHGQPILEALEIALGRQAKAEDRAVLLYQLANLVGPAQRIT